ncbi:MAG: hypothetical protein A3A82_01950 [Candidatus Pacebacteria bacterium RIFCSPLOWO2_01_FULL_47_12]|nr:MAG: hypothetical protein A3A82_01950 [Candidatus Pacebacteria bacterium RIFCSPLOWO2_01_FULL_47_12]
MKVFYTTSLRGVTDNRNLLEKIYALIEKLGHTNLDDVLFNIPDKEGFYSGSHKEKVGHFKRMISCIKKADVVLLEVSTHSLSMGFILHKALELGKPVIALHLPGNSPFFAQGIEDEKLQVLEYRKDTMENIIRLGLDYAAKVSDIRFNFFIPPSIAQFLDIISKVKKIPRSVYIRALIEEDMKKADMKALMDLNS